MAKLNAQKSLIGRSKHAIAPSSVSVLDRLKTDLGLDERPRIIFGCDISHYYGTNIVSSVVVFIDGKPERNGTAILTLHRLRLEKAMTLRP